MEKSQRAGTRTLLAGVCSSEVIALPSLMVGCGVRPAGYFSSAGDHAERAAKRAEWSFSPRPWASAAFISCAVADVLGKAT